MFTCLNRALSRILAAPMPVREDHISKLSGDTKRHIASFLGEFQDVVNYSMANKSILISLVKVRAFETIFQRQWVKDKRAYTIYKVHLYQLIHSIRINKKTSPESNPIQLLFKKKLLYAD